jgi:DNA-binding LytR/AlgR family response regulator
MDKIKILIVEDDISEAIRLETGLSELGYNVLPVADNFQQAIGVFYSSDPDIVLIDIRLKGEKTGIDLGCQISSDQVHKKPIVYLTSNRDKSVFEDAKHTKPCAFLLKPVDIDSIDRTLELAIDQFAQIEFKNDSLNLETGIFFKENLFIKKDKKLIKLAIKDIEYIEVESKYSSIYISNKRYLVRISLTKLMEQLSQEIFLRIHRNYIVNLNKIKEINLEELTVSLNNISLNVSEKHKKELVKKMPFIQ